MRVYGCGRNPTDALRERGCGKYLHARAAQAASAATAAVVGHVDVGGQEAALQRTQRGAWLECSRRSALGARTTKCGPAPAHGRKENERTRSLSRAEGPECLLM
jgi:hypothetical protein